MLYRLNDAFSGAVTIIVVLFIMQNLADVEVHFLLWSMTMPRALMLAVVFMLGAAVGFLVRSRVGRKNAA
tara:strand:+ start:22 stop:231 length:210 start_codon:yes stop_codon:yes gene_type:complete